MSFRYRSLVIVFLAALSGLLLLRSARSKTEPSRPAPALTRPSSGLKDFTTTQTPHFDVYVEGKPASSELLQMLERIQARRPPAASPTKEARVTVFLFRDRERYRRVTGRPEGSRGASVARRRRIYAYESEDLEGTLAQLLRQLDEDVVQAAAPGP